MQNVLQDNKQDSDINYSKKRKIAWAFLMLAILLEVCGVAMLNAIPLWLSPFSVDGIVEVGALNISSAMIAKGVLLCMIAASYYCMSLALRKIALGVAYSVWEIVGMIGILLISFLFFQPQLTIKEYAGIAIGFIGITCVIIGEEH